MPGPSWEFLEHETMSTEIAKIFCGQVYITSDGEQFTVADLDLEDRYAVIENPDDDRGVIALGEMLEAVRTGEFVCVDKEGEEAQDAEKTD